MDPEFRFRVMVVVLGTLPVVLVIIVLFME